MLNTSFGQLLLSLSRLPRGARHNPPFWKQESRENTHLSVSTIRDFVVGPAAKPRNRAPCRLASVMPKTFSYGTLCKGQHCADWRGHAAPGTAAFLPGK